jgi:DNA-3-methyladenine glycosylase II
VIGALQAQLPGLRPVLFSSPGEGGLWALLVQRTPRPRARALLQGLGERYGARLRLGDRVHVAPPQPGALVDADVPGLDTARVARIRGLARAATDGMLDPIRLAADPERSIATLRRIPGIGPFGAGLMVLRAAGVRDALPTEEPRTEEAVAVLYPRTLLGGPARLADVASDWRPFRTWGMVLVRVAWERGLKPA